MSANEVAKRLGVTTDFQPTTNFDLVVAGGWAGRWDMSAGSVTITEERKGKLDFTPPYYYTPAQMGVVTDSGITSLDGLAGKTVCVGEQTTYLVLAAGHAQARRWPAQAPLPAGIEARLVRHDTQCADAIKAGRREFEGWLTRQTTLTALSPLMPRSRRSATRSTTSRLRSRLTSAGPPHAKLAG